MSHLDIEKCIIPDTHSDDNDQSSTTSCLHLDDSFSVSSSPTPIESTAKLPYSNDQIKSKNSIESKFHLFQGTKESTILSSLKSILCSNFLSEEKLSCCGLQFLDSIHALRLLKFNLVIISMIIAMYYFVRLLEWEHDETLTIKYLFTFDFHNILLDIIVFFFIGRLGSRRGVDRIFPFILPMGLSCVYSSYMTNIWFLQISFTSETNVLEWPWQLYLYTGLFGLGFLVIIALYLYSSVNDASVVYRITEWSLVFGAFVIPIVMNESFHLHHWFVGWLLGMNFNREEWWSQVVMAIALGQYVNGIAVYGRDPIVNR